MNSVAERASDIRSRGDRRGICSHCGWYEGVSNVKMDNPLGNHTVGTAKPTTKYRIIM